jgi:hypothetical protein
MTVLSTYDKIDRIMAAADKLVKTKEAKYRLDDIQLYPGYAEPGYDQPESGVVATGNWNSISHYVRETNEFITDDDILCRVSDWLEKIGVGLEWEDEWVPCDYCDKIFRTSADSYGRKKAGVIDEEGCCCEKCIVPEDHLEKLEGNDHSCNTLDIDPADHGYIQLNEDSFENGFHPGQDADPKVIGETLREAGITRYLFNLNSTGQFDLDFSVWVHESEDVEKARTALDEGSVNGPSNSENLRHALQDASKKIAEKHKAGALAYQVDTFTRAYLECMLWSSNDESTPQGGEPLDKNYSPEDLALETLEQVKKDCADFCEQAGEALTRMEGYPKEAAAQAGHDFWLSRNGHGSGFFDEDKLPAKEDRGFLQELSHKFGEQNPYVGDDGAIYLM